jgi:hypothetical protein
MTEHPATANPTTGIDGTPTTQTTPPGNGRNSIDQLGHALTEPLAAIARVLPTGPIPVVLGAGALAVAGVVEWPIVAAIGLGYLALRRWH